MKLKEMIMKNEKQKQNALSWMEEAEKGNVLDPKFLTKLKLASMEGCDIDLLSPMKIYPLTAKTPGISDLFVVTDPEEIERLTVTDQFGIDKRNNVYCFDNGEWKKEKITFMPLTGNLI